MSMQRTINITGRARNTKGQAALVAANACPYFIAGMLQWDKEWLGQTVRAIGNIIEDKKNKRLLIEKPVLQLVKIE